MSNITIGLVDDDALIVSLLKSFLENQEGIEIVLTAESGEGLLEQLKNGATPPEVLVMDLKMKALNGAETAQELKESNPDIKVIILSSHYNKSFMGFMLKTGVSAFIPKGYSTDRLLEIIREVHAKGYYFTNDQLDVVRDQVSSKSPKPTVINENALSEREIEVLRLICFQKTAKEIGEELFITQRTVEGHKSNLFLKTETKNLAGLIVYAFKNEIVDPDEILLI